MKTVFAQTDIPSAITSLSGYATAAVVIGISCLVWSVGRYLVYRMTGTRDLPLSSWGEDMGVSSGRNPDSGTEWDTFTPQGRPSATNQDGHDE